MQCNFAGQKHDFEMIKMFTDHEIPMGMQTEAGYFILARQMDDYPNILSTALHGLANNVPPTM